MSDVDPARARCDAATPGRWWAEEDPDGGGGWDIVPLDHSGPHIALSDTGAFARREDAEFTAHARTDLPAALDEVERLRAENADMRAALDRAAGDALHEAAEAARSMHDPVASDCAEWADWLDAQSARVGAADNGEHFPWQYTEFGVVCACGLPMDRDETCAVMRAAATVTPPDRGEQGDE